jgi:hypothetical protein
MATAFNRKRGFLRLEGIPSGKVRPPEGIPDLVGRGRIDSAQV